MSRVDPKSLLTPSLLDRLSDDEPEAKAERARPGYQLLRELHDAVRRDLEDLLNARRRCIPVPEGCPETSRSVLEFGISDLAGEDLVSEAGRKRFLKNVEEVILRFEPRLKRVRVLEATDDASDRRLHFRIEAVLQAEPAPEAIVLDSELEPVTHSFEVVS